MIRVRFTTDGRDYRPVLFPPKHPWWCTGYNEYDEAVIVAYADSEEQIAEYWPDYEEFNILDEDVGDYKFSDRMPRPEWFNV